MLLATSGGVAGAGSESSTQAAAQPLTPTVEVEPEEEVPAGPSPEEINDQIRELIAQRASEMEEQLRQQYDEQLGGLQKQLEVAKQECRRPKAARDRRAKGQRGGSGPLEEWKPKGWPRKKPKQRESPRRRPQPPLRQRKPEKRKPQSLAAAAAAQAEPEPVAPAPVSQVRRGDLVTMGPGVDPPKLLRRPSPRFPVMAKRLNRREAKVLIRVLIDENGKVIKAELAGKEQGYGFDDEALSAARKSAYQPAKKNGVPVKFWHTLAVEFRDR